MPIVTTVTMGEQRVQGGPSELLQMMNSADVGAKHLLHVKALNAKCQVSPKLQVPIPEVKNVLAKRAYMRFTSLPDL